MLSINQFTGLLKSMAEAHEQIGSFGEGNAWEIGASKAVGYPLLWVSALPSNTDQKLLNMKFCLIIADLVLPDKSNEPDVLSDTQQIALDILAQLNAPEYNDNFILDPHATLSPFTEKFDDDVAGWKVDISIRVNYLADRCAVPSALQPATITNPCAPVAVQNSDGSFTAVYQSGTTHTLADILFTDSDGIQTSKPSQVDITAKSLGQLLAEDTINQIYDALSAVAKLTGLIEALPDTDLAALDSGQLQYILNTLLSNQFLQDNLTTGQRNSMNELYPLPTGQTTSYSSGDDGDLKHGRLADFFTLKTNNIFGNTHRFTDENGNQSYASNYVIDHATGLGWYRLEQTATTWTNAISNSNNLIVSTSIGDLDGFHLPNMHEFLSLMNMENSNNAVLNYPPFNISGSSSGRWLSTSLSNPTTSAIKMSSAIIPQITTGSKTTSAPFFTVRMHFI